MRREQLEVGLRRVVVGILLISSFISGGSALAAGEEAILAVEEWVADPRRIDELELSDLVRLPWLDEPTAASILALRDLGGLRRPEDLQRIPGLEAQEIAALLPLLRGWAPERREQRRIEVRLREGGGDPWQLRVEREGKFLGGRWLQTGEGAVGSLEFRSGRWGALLGRQRLGLGSVLLGAAGRSRTALLSRTARGPSLRSSSTRAADQAVDALALRVGGGSWVGLLGMGRGVSWWSSEWRQDAARIGFAASREYALWIQLPSARLDLARSRGGTWRSSLRLGIEREEWRLLWAATTSEGIGHGVDPIGGHALDRDHRSWQFQAARGGVRLRGEFLLRRIWREGAASRQRVQLRIRDLSPAAWWLRLRFDEDLEMEGADPAWQIDLTRQLRSPGTGQWRVGLRRQLPGASELWTLRWLPTGGLVFEAATTRGGSSQVWIPPLSGLAFAPTWLAPGDAALSGAFRAGPLGLWMGARRDAESEIRWQGGLNFRWRGRWCEGC